VTVRRLGDLGKIVQAATDTSTGLGDIVLQGSYVNYTIWDCAALRAAAEDADTRADALAQALGVDRGSVTGASNYAYSPLLWSYESGRRVRLQLHTPLLLFVPHLLLYFHAESRPRLSVVSSPTRTSPALGTTGLEVPCPTRPARQGIQIQAGRLFNARARRVRWSIVAFEGLTIA
jgi:hypothetical protein